MALDLQALASSLAPWRRLARPLAVAAACTTLPFVAAACTTLPFVAAWTAPAAAQPQPSRAAPGLLPWSQVRIEAGARSVVVPRSQAGELAALVTSMLGSPSDEDDPSAPVSLRLELAQGDQDAGVLERAGTRWRWTSLRSGGQARMLRAHPRVDEALLEEAQRLLGR